MYTAAHTHPPGYPRSLLSNDCQSWLCRYSALQTFPLNPKPYFTFGYQSLKAICPAPPAEASKQGLGKGSHLLFICFTAGNVHMCQGCRSSIRLSNESIIYPL